MKRRCLKCGAEWEIKGPIAVREECPECAAYVHTCTNCAHFDSRTRACRLPNTDPARDWNDMNFCEEFEYGPGGTGSAEKARPAARPSAGAAPRAPERPPTEEEARRKFEGLFRDPKQ
ncbi:MAG: hypothetical protein FJ288_08670 [Planctomycetes bacterium]|nr:hypothetical protein [Planctomycetota bacterium]